MPEQAVQKKPQTLSERIRAITDKIPEWKGPDYTKPNLTESCVICGTVRMDSEPTGVTCGDARCLEELGKKFSKEEEVRGKLQEMAEKLGLDEKKLPEDLVELAEAIEDEIGKVVDAVEENED